MDAVVNRILKIKLKVLLASALGCLLSALNAQDNKDLDKWMSKFASPSLLTIHNKNWPFPLSHEAVEGILNGNDLVKLITPITDQSGKKFDLVPLNASIFFQITPRQKNIADFSVKKLNAMGPEEMGLIYAGFSHVFDISFDLSGALRSHVLYALEPLPSNWATAYGYNYSDEEVRGIPLIYAAKLYWHLKILPPAQKRPSFNDLTNQHLDLPPRVVFFSDVHPNPGHEMFLNFPAIDIFKRSGTQKVSLFMEIFQQDQQLTVDTAITQLEKESQGMKDSLPEVKKILETSQATVKNLEQALEKNPNSSEKASELEVARAKLAKWVRLRSRAEYTLVFHSKNLFLLRMAKDWERSGMSVRVLGINVSN